MGFEGFVECGIIGKAALAAGFYGRDAFAQHTAGMGEPKRHDVGVHGGIGICFKVAVYR